MVALWFLVLDWIQGDPLRTPELLGSALLRQPPRLPAVFHYSIVHGLAFVLFGVVGAVLIAAAERQPVFIFPLVILFTAFEVGFFGAVIILAKSVLDEVAGWEIFTGNLLAASGHAGLLLQGTPPPRASHARGLLRRRLTNCRADAGVTLSRHPGDCAA